MPLPWKVRVAFGLQKALTKAHLLPDADRMLRMSPAKRMAFGPSKGMVGAVPTVATEDRQITMRDGASVRVRLYRAPEATDQPLLYIHGGGFVMGGIRACDHLCRRLAGETGAVVVSVEYRLAPEHRYPGPLHDVLDVAQWLFANASELGVDPEKLVVGGDSAGGNLAAATAVVFRDEGRPLAGQVLIYPVVDLALSLPGIHAYDGPGLTSDEGRRCAEEYLGDHDPTDPYASPWYADPTGLAPAFVLTVHHDPLHYEGVAYAEKLRAAGVPVEHVDLEDHAHGSLSLPTLYKGVDDLYGTMTEFIRKVTAHTS